MHKMNVFLVCHVNWYVFISEDSVEGWTPISGSTHNVTSVDVLVSPKQIKLVKSFLNCNSIRYTTTILDLQRAIGNLEE